MKCNIICTSWKKKGDQSKCSFIIILFSLIFHLGAWIFFQGKNISSYLCSRTSSVSNGFVPWNIEAPSKCKHVQWFAYIYEGPSFNPKLVGVSHMNPVAPFQVIICQIRLLYLLSISLQNDNHHKICSHIPHPNLPDSPTILLHHSCLDVDTSPFSYL